MNQKHQGIGMTSQRTRDRLIQRLSDQGIKDKRVLEIMRSTPRHIFVDEALASRSYEDTALPIGHGQTISQPYIVARMTEALLASSDADESPTMGENSQGPKKVLEVGTGSGYQTAVLSQLVGQVYSVERIQPLLDRARSRFIEMGLRNIRLNYSDGGWGWKDHAPFDAIIVTAAPSEIPNSLLEQLAVGGKLIIPVGPSGEQELLQVIRTEDGYDRETLDMVSFVPLVSGVK